ncbi:MAG TPA: 4-hydroxy-3-methylbut-2-enyl diphosphate reductase [Armatimonadetes bacterium]|nr:4-hydroxy-3-methylbut-2-enyl diphosphate reductase [Armatimonadota bacterium]
MKRIVLAAPRGFCAGVSYAIDLVEHALRRFGTPLYVRHAIVHNQWVVRDFERRGVVFVEDLEEVPLGQPVIFSAHGVSPAVREHARRRRLRVIDATCPLVTKVHREALDLAAKGYTILYLGHRGHPEAEGTMGEAPQHMILVETRAEAETVEVPDPERVACLTQTTLSVDEVNLILAVLRRRFPRLITPRKEDICFATTNRQEAVKALARSCDLVLVVGSKMSSNSNRLREVAEAQGVPAFLIDGVADLRPEWKTDYETVGLTSGASTPEKLVEEVVTALKGGRPVEVQTVEVAREKIAFPLPPELW